MKNNNKSKGGPDLKKGMDKDTSAETMAPQDLYKKVSDEEAQGITEVEFEDDDHGGDVTDKVPEDDKEQPKVVKIGEKTIATAGNVHVLVAPPGSGKSEVVAAVLAAALTTSPEGASESPPDDALTLEAGKETITVHSHTTPERWPLEIKPITDEHVQKIAMTVHNSTCAYRNAFSGDRTMKPWEESTVPERQTTVDIVNAYLESRKIPDTENRQWLLLKAIVDVLILDFK